MISVHNLDEVIIVIVTDDNNYDATTIRSFKELVQRGANLWPDAPADIKEFADLITDGTIKQDYRGQDTSASSKEKNKRKYRIAKIVEIVHRDAILIMCSCGVSEELPEETATYQCKNCKTYHTIKDYVK